MDVDLQIAVLGAGGCGACLGAALDRAGEDVLLIAREPTAEAIGREGLTVESARLGGFHTQPKTATQLDQPTDVLVVATKAKDLPSALARIKGEPALVVPLLNGLDHLETLCERFGPRAVAASIRIPPFRPEPPRRRQTSMFLPRRPAT